MTAVSKMVHIDPHVHMRDWNESNKATIRSVMDLARSQGVVASIEMPNTNPPITTEKLVAARLEKAREEGVSEGHYIFIGVTRYTNQIKKAAKIAETNPKVVGIKLFAGKSVGNLAVSDENDQKRVYKVLAKEGYEGPVVVHCEKESRFQMGWWIPEQPYTWDLARPPSAEVESVSDQIKFAREARFKGHIHVAHITVPEAVRLVDEAKAELSISSGATPHHLTLSTDDMLNSEGLKYKVNPPIRIIRHVRALQELLRTGKIDVIETDHAPHLPEEKTYDPERPIDFYKSGIPSLNSYKQFLENLMTQGFTEDGIRALTYTNVKNIFTKVAE